jgi:hypothetical protein
MIISRLSRSTKSSASSKNEIIKREFERFKKIIKNKTSVNSRSFRRDSDEVETESNSQRFVVDSTSFIISASFVIVVSTSSVTIVFASSITLFSISASFDESIVNSIFEEMNRDVLIRLLTILISFFADFANVSVADLISI